jgi:DNA-binding CsgD family transcriptional regulator
MSNQRKDNEMTLQNFAHRAVGPANALFEGAPPTVAGYERELAKRDERLRQALAREEALIRRNEELIQHEEVLRNLLAWREDAADRVASLTPRERQIMELVLAGHPNKNIAADLGINQRTVENHRAAIMHKTGSKSLPALARLALSAAWNDAGQPFVQPLARLALGAAWNDAGEAPTPRTAQYPSAG